MTDFTRYEALLQRLSHLPSLLVAYSGGVDSTLLAVAAHAALGDRCRCVLAVGDVSPEGEAAAARELAGVLGLSLIEVETQELADARFTANPPDRCYWCKIELFGLLRGVADAHGLAFIADGSNADDLADHRPGSRAAAESGVISPLQDVGMTKADIRSIACELGLPNGNKPSMACLASRFPYGEAITESGIAQVAAAENALRGLGLRQFRVRSHGTVARVEVAPDEMEAAWLAREAISAAGRLAGFSYAALDLEGYRTGSLNEVLPEP
ncbi:MAG: ATP-dependent sacrificial sulfur transferase LarE [Coriobacteriia bacterium]|nr:ATP-dependent sacrificial sulfur transferase LarE [Coriobacteriia bacterium]